MKLYIRTHQSVNKAEMIAMTTAAGLRGTAISTKKNIVGTIMSPYVTIIHGHSGPTCFEIVREG